MRPNRTRNLARPLLTKVDTINQWASGFLGRTKAVREHAEEIIDELSEEMLIDLYDAVDACIIGLERLDMIELIKIHELLKDVVEPQVTRRAQSVQELSIGKLHNEDIPEEYDTNAYTGEALESKRVKIKRPKTESDKPRKVNRAFNPGAYFVRGQGKETND